MNIVFPSNALNSFSVYICHQRFMEYAWPTYTIHSVWSLSSVRLSYFYPKILK